MVALAMTMDDELGDRAAKMTRASGVTVPVVGLRGTLRIGPLPHEPSPLVESLRRCPECTMSARRIVGLALVAIGMIILLWGGIFWRDRDTVVDAGPLKVQTSERKGVALPPLFGAGVLVAGVILVVVTGRRTT
jgi:hypothetical protein